VLNTLREEEQVRKVGRAYQLDPRSILKLDDEVQHLKYNYFLKTKSELRLAPSESKKFVFHSLSELDKFWNHILYDKFDELKPKTYDYTQHAPHAWFNLVQMGEEVKVVQAILQNTTGFYTLSNSKTELDEWIGKFYKGKKMKYTMRKKPIPRERFHQYAVLGDYVIESFWPKEIALRFDKLFRRSKNISTLNVPELVAIAHTPIDIAVTLYRNKRKAERMRAQILKEF